MSTVNDNILLDTQYIIFILIMLNLCCAIQELDRGIKPSPARARSRFQTCSSMTGVRTFNEARKNEIRSTRHHQCRHQIMISGYQYLIPGHHNNRRHYVTFHVIARAKSQRPGRTPPTGDTHPEIFRLTVSSSARSRTTDTKKPGI